MGPRGGIPGRNMAGVADICSSGLSPFAQMALETLLLPSSAQRASAWCQAASLRRIFGRSLHLFPGAQASTLWKGQELERRGCGSGLVQGLGVDPSAVRGCGGHRAPMGEGKEELGCVPLRSTALGSRGVPGRSVLEEVMQKPQHFLCKGVGLDARMEKGYLLELHRKQVWCIENGIY